MVLVPLGPAPIDAIPVKGGVFKAPLEVCPLHPALILRRPATSDEQANDQDATTVHDPIQKNSYGALMRTSINRCPDAPDGGLQPTIAERVGATSTACIRRCSVWLAIPGPAKITGT